MDENFLLSTPLARKLFHDCAKTLPIIDYHNHLQWHDLYTDRQYQNLAELWLLSDPYKHRAMRICGVEEKYITGDAGEYEKFRAWMKTLPRLVGNPIYDWAILEMKRVFGIELEPGKTDIRKLWEETKEKLALPVYSAEGILKGFHVEYAAPCASAEEDISEFRSLPYAAPSLRGDSLVEADGKTVAELEKLTQHPIFTLSDYFKAISLRLDRFGEMGCRFADHALDNGFEYVRDDGKCGRRFLACRQGILADGKDRTMLRSEILRFLAGEYAGRGWTMQLHIGAQRSTSTRLRRVAGPAGGFAGIGNSCNLVSLTRMLDDFEQGPNGLPGILLFNLNPADNAMMAVLSGSYSEDGIPGKVQQGPAWWWCDHLYGMRQNLECVSAFGVLSVSLGMTTDSRSILSFVRHEYFRRMFCGWMGEKVEKGELPASEDILKKLVEDVCYNNVKKRIGQGGKAR